MTTLIALVAAGIVFIVIVAIVVGVVDAAQAPSRREVAAERRQRWEDRQREFHGVEPSRDDGHNADWDDD